MLAGYLLFLPGKAEAGCAHDSPAVGYFEQLVKVGALADSGDSPEPWKPCSGPQCKDGRGIPPGPLLTLLILKSCAFLDDLSHSHFESTSSLPIARASFPSSAHTSQIFHPPRPVR